MDLLTLLKAMQTIGAVKAQLPEIKALFDSAIGLLRNPDQDIAKAAYQDVIADNDAGHARLQGKLNEAAQR